MSIANGTSGFPARRDKAKGKIVPLIPVKADGFGVPARPAAAFFGLPGSHVTGGRPKPVPVKRPQSDGSG
ncbi:hypothetical protein [Rhodomicrobium lacus]|uniref:hypothetical protein n=1 Tax=Rhodomicrobium lacus TaxID=2498452 RepID=UPI0026E45CEC|nr:hypothetical protein [Rhodomicrobium lacus]WKW52465.1 hypothetical protein QMO75_08360 [Rhodomicrobium lacus]